jgi:hypothetical protein
VQKKIVLEEVTDPEYFKKARKYSWDIASNYVFEMLKIPLGYLKMMCEVPWNNRLCEDIFKCSKTLTLIYHK